MRRIAALLPALALTVSLAACGGSGGGGAKGSDGSAAANDLVALAKQVGDRTADENSAHMEFTGGMGAMQMKGAGDIKVGGDNPAISMNLDTGQGSMAIILIDGVLYMKLPAGLSPGGGKPWIKIDSNDKNNPLAQALGTMTDQLKSNADPRQMLEQFKEAGEITSTSKETLDGAQTTHYKITVNVKKLVDNQKDATIKKAMQEAVRSGLKDFPLDLWVNGDNLPVRVSIDMPTPDPTSGKASKVKVQVDYSKWGVPVNIAAPPADQVGEFPH